MFVVDDDDDDDVGDDYDCDDNGDDDGDGDGDGDDDDDDGGDDGDDIGTHDLIYRLRRSHRASTSSRTGGWKAEPSSKVRFLCHFKGNITQDSCLR